MSGSTPIGGAQTTPYTRLRGAFSFSPDGDAVLWVGHELSFEQSGPQSGRTTPGVKRFDAKTGALRWSFTGRRWSSQAFCDAGLTRDGRELLAACRDGELIALDAETGQRAAVPGALLWLQRTRWRRWLRAFRLLPDGARGVAARGRAL
jgi:hypothetical protein